MSLYKSFLEAVEKGKRGEAIWIPVGFEKIGLNVGVVQRCYTLVGGMSGTGKTAFVDLAYVLNPYEWIRKYPETGVKIKWLYWSLERSHQYKLAKWTCLYLWQRYQIKIDVPTLLQWGGHRNKIKEDIYQKIYKATEYFEELLQHIQLMDGSINPTGIYKEVCRYAYTHGKIETVTLTQKDGSEYNKKVYIPNDPKLVTIIIIDHIGKLTGETDNHSKRFMTNNEKPLLDKMSEYASTEFRDRFGFSPVLISQFNRSSEETMRRVKTDNGPLPTDFKGSGNMYEDCDVCLGLYNPWKLKDSECLEYKTERFVTSTGLNRLRTLTVMKNSYGADDLGYGLAFLGECGYIHELPKAEDFNTGKIKYMKYLYDNFPSTSNH